LYVKAFSYLTEGMI